MIVNFCNTAQYKQMYNELFYVVNQANLTAKFDCYCNSITIQFSPDVDITTNLIVLFANISKKYKCDFMVSNFLNCLTFNFFNRL